MHAACVLHEASAARVPAANTPLRRRFEFGVRCLAGRVPGRSGTAGLVFYMSSYISADSLRNVGERGCSGKGNPQHGDPGPRRARISTSTEKSALARRLCFSPYFDRTFTTAHPTTGNFLGCRCSYITESLQRAGASRERAAPATERLHTERIVYMDVLLEKRSPQRSRRRCSPSLSSGRASGRARFHRRFTSVLHAVHAPQL